MALGNPIVRAIQANFDHLMGALRALARAHNVMVDDLQEVSGEVSNVKVDISNVTTSITNVERKVDAVPIGPWGEDDSPMYFVGPIGPTGATGATGATGPAGADGTGGGSAGLPAEAYEEGDGFPMPTPAKPLAIWFGNQRIDVTGLEFDSAFFNDLGFDPTNGDYYYIGLNPASTVEDITAILSSKSVGNQTAGVAWANHRHYFDVVGSGLNPPPGFPGEDGEDGFFVPGPKGDTGATGATGATGPPGADGTGGSGSGSAGLPAEAYEEGDGFGAFIPPRGMEKDPLWRAKGDLASGSGPNAGIRTAVGADGSLLMADSSAPGGISWQTGTTTVTRSVWLPAAAAYVDSSTTAAEGQSGTTPDRIGHHTWSDGATEGSIFSFIVPSDWKAGTSVTARLYFSGSTAFDGVVAVRTQRQYLNVAADASTVGAGTLASVNITPAGTYAAGDLYIDSARSVGTPANAGDIIRIQWQRVGGNAADTYTGNLRVHGILVEYTAEIPAGATGATGATGPAGSSKMAYIWMSKPNPATGLGRRFYAERAFTITNVYAWCTDGAPSGTLQMDVRKNGTSIYPSASKPTVTAGNFLGADTTPDTTGVSKGDKLEVYLTTLAGATGRVGVAISGTYL